jgi:hypothetical protein
VTLLATVALSASMTPAFARQLAAAPDAPLVVIRSQYRRLPFPQDIRRIAVADTEILTAELITSREVLVLGRQTGRTTLIVWFADGSSREFAFAVQRDLSLLERALARVHPSIQVESAPDRDALVLTGLVPDLETSLTAEAIARNYLDAGSDGAVAQPLVATPPAPGAAGPQAAAPAPASTQLRGPLTPSGAVINLIQLDTLPLVLEDKIRDAVRGVESVGVQHLDAALTLDPEHTAVLSDLDEQRVPRVGRQHLVLHAAGVGVDLRPGRGEERTDQQGGGRDHRDERASAHGVSSQAAFRDAPFGTLSSRRSPGRSPR